MTNCPRCNSSNIIKYGFYGNWQRYRCKECLKSFTLKLPKSHSEYKGKAIKLSLEGQTLRAIGKSLGVSHQKIFRWVKQFNENNKNAETAQKTPDRHRI
jgi:transposase-like protein